MNDIVTVVRPSPPVIPPPLLGAWAEEGAVQRLIAYKPGLLSWGMETKRAFIEIHPNILHFEAF